MMEPTRSSTGQQRTLSICQFVNDDFSMVDAGNSYEDRGKLSLLLAKILWSWPLSLQSKSVLTSMDG